MDVAVVTAQNRIKSSLLIGAPLVAETLNDLQKDNRSQAVEHLQVS